MSHNLVHTDQRCKAAVSIKVNDFGGAPMAEHDMPCPVCMDEKAVYLIGYAPYFQPCRKCESYGWVTVRATGWRRRVLQFLGLLNWVPRR